MIHEHFGFLAKVGTLGNVGAEDVAGGDLGDAEAAHEDLRLGAFTYAGSAEQQNRPGQEGVVCGGRLCMCC